MNNIVMFYLMELIMSFRDDALTAIKLISFQNISLKSQNISLFAATAYLAFMAMMHVLFQWLIAGSASRFDPSGLNSAVAQTCAGFLVIAAFARRDSSGATLRLLILAAAGLDLTIATALIAIHFAVGAQHNEPINPLAPILVSATTVVATVWMVAISRGIFKRLAFVRWPGLRAIGLAFCSLFAVLALPLQPTFIVSEDNPPFYNLWDAAREILRDRKADEAKAHEEAAKWRAWGLAKSRLESAQPERLAAESKQIAPRTAGRANVFVIGVSGWSSQRVFERETGKSLDILARQFGAEGHVAALINDESAHASHPLATVQNLAALVRQVAGRMDRDSDALILTMTSHGSRDGFALSDSGGVDETLDPATLKTILDEAGIRYRILIVSACHSGVFLPALSDPNTMILTAASAERTSFGCANDREWTYFGDAFFAHGLKKGASLSEAFIAARDLIHHWEQEQNLAPSEPQIYIGSAVAARFPDLIGKPLIDLEGTAPPLPPPYSPKRAAL